MHIRAILDPMSLNGNPDPEHHPCLYEGDGEDSLEIYFENEEKKILVGNNTDDYIAEG